MGQGGLDLHGGERTRWYKTGSVARFCAVRDNYGFDIPDGAIRSGRTPKTKIFPPG